MGSRGLGDRRCRERGPTGRKQQEAESRARQRPVADAWEGTGRQTREQGWITPARAGWSKESGLDWK